MKRDYNACRKRLENTMFGITPDRVPLVYLTSEDISARVSGLTIRELISSHALLAEKTILVNDFLGGDGMATAVNVYCGPFEGLAYAIANDKKNVFVWKDYTTPFVKEGQICKTEKDIENLIIPDHTEIEPWPTLFKAIAIIQEQTGIGLEQFSPSLTWSSVQMLRGSQAYLDVRMNPDLLMQICEKIYMSQWDYYQAYCKMAGQPSFAFQCTYAFNQHMLSFDDAWKFEGQFIVRFAKESGLPMVIHNCGFKPYHIELIERLQQEGVVILALNASHPLDLDWWVEFQKKFPDITIMGGLHVNAEMENGTVEDVTNRVKDVIMKLGHTNRLVITPTCCMPWRIPLNNIKAVTDAVEKYGNYPLR